MGFRIQKATSIDVPAILGMIQEFAKYSALEQYLEVTQDSLHDVMFGKNAFVYGLVAYDGETPAGYALFYPGFLSFRGQRSVYLEDIFVSEHYRASGIGRKLIIEAAKKGAEFGAVRMDFQVLRSNSEAKAFYKKLGAIVDEEERHFKFVDEIFLSLLS